MNVLLVSHDCGGTIPPMLALAEAFVDRGDRVRWLAQPSVEKRADDAGCRFVAFDAVGDYDPHRLLEEQLETGLPLISGHAIGDQLLAIASDDTSDLVVVDANLSGALAAAESLDAASAVLLHSMYKTFVDTWFGDLWPLLAAPINETRTHFGLAPCASWAGMFAAHDRVISVVPDSLDAPVEGRPENLRSFGFLVPRGRAITTRTDAADTEPVAGADIVVGLSTTNQGQNALLQTILDAIAELDVRALVSTAGQVDASSLRARPTATLREFVDYRAALPNARVMVTHAGTGTISAALDQGVPLVCTPIARDQHLNAERVAALGAGIDVGSDPAPNDIADAIRTVLGEPIYRRAATTLARESANAGGAPAAAAELASVVESA